MSKKFVASLILCSLTLASAPMVSGTPASQGGIQYSVSEDGPWLAGPSGSSNWIRCLSADGASLSAGPAVEMRLSQGTVAHLVVNEGGYAIRDLDGRVFVKIDGRSQVDVVTGRSRAVATTGEFLLQGNGERLDVEVFSGDAQPLPAQGEVVASAEPQTDAPADQELLLAGPDVRSRGTDEDEMGRDRVRGAKELPPPDPVPPPPVPVAPPPPPAVVPTAPPPPTVVQPPPPVVEGGGGFSPAFIAIPLVAGGLVALLVGGGDTPPAVVAPASP